MLRQCNKSYKFLSFSALRRSHDDVKRLPLVLVPGLTVQRAALRAADRGACGRYGPVTVADHRRDGEIGGDRRDAFSMTAPPRFALAGLSYGGYIAFAMLRQAPERIAKLALLDTSARPDTPEQSAQDATNSSPWRKPASSARSSATLAPRFLHRNRRNDEALSGDACATWWPKPAPEAFVRQQQAIMSRPDSRPLLASIRCPTLVLVGDGDELHAAGAGARNRRAAFPARGLSSCPDAGIYRPSNSPMR